MKKSGGLAILGLVMVLAILLYLVSIEARSLAPVLQDQQEAARTVAGPGELPNLDQMQDATASHAAELDAALSGEESASEK